MHAAPWSRQCKVVMSARAAYKVQRACDDCILACACMQARALSVGRILFGYYQLPDSSAEPIDFVVNPEGLQLRAKQRRGTPLTPLHPCC